MVVRGKQQPRLAGDWANSNLMTCQYELFANNQVPERFRVPKSRAQGFGV